MGVGENRINVAPPVPPLIVSRCLVLFNEQIGVVGKGRVEGEGKEGVKYICSGNYSN